MKAQSIVGVCTIVLVLGCTTAGGRPGNRIEPAEMISRDAYDLMTAASGRQPTPMQVTYEVMIDSTGRPDMSTLKVFGIGSSENREGISHWLEHASYKPAYQNGQPVPGLLKGRLESRIEVRRMP